jgi:hypothetical protein
MKKHLLLLLLLAGAAAYAEWPIDDEPYGFLGCKQLRFKGMWECTPDSVHPEESIDGVCISVALSNVMMYYQWPMFSRFDGVYLKNSYEGITKHINARWNYGLITGSRTTDDCETDSPETRHDPLHPERSGVDELRRLLYAVERSFGFDHNFFKTKDSTACQGDGYFAVEHVMRNRFGFPNCRTIDANKPDSRSQVIEELKKEVPVIAMRCDHIYLLDGYRFDPVKKRDLVHSSDYIQGEASIGWFPWKALYNEKLDRFVVDVNPRLVIPAGPSTTTIGYFWGDGYIPGTKYTKRKGRLLISREKELPLGNLDVAIYSTDLTRYGDDTRYRLYTTGGYHNGRLLTVPENKPFSFEVSEEGKIELVITNKDPLVKNIRVLFCDILNEKS